MSRKRGSKRVRSNAITCFNTAGDYSPSTGDRESVFNGHEEGLFSLSSRGRDRRLHLNHTEQRIGCILLQADVNEYKILKMNKLWY